MFLQQLFVKGLGHASYLVGDAERGAAAVIDPRRDVDAYLDLARDEQLRITDILGGTPVSGVEVHRNNITGFSAAGLHNDEAASANATCNWWGSATGPTNAGNPGGTGEEVVGPAVFIPFLIAPAPGGPCGLPAPSVPVPGLSPLALLLLMLTLGAAGWKAVARVRR